MLRPAFALALLTPLLAVAQPAHSAPQRTVDMGGDWKYLPYDGEGNMAVESIDDSGWPTMALPSNWYLMGSKSYPSRARAEMKRPGPREVSRGPGRVGIPGI